VGERESMKAGLHRQRDLEDLGLERQQGSRLSP
jgi:hypothetical protein